jgi:hypothetical protein
VKQIGARAQDFQAAFGLGENPAIATVDVDGVGVEQK